MPTIMLGRPRKDVHEHSHRDPAVWDIQPPFEDEPAKGKSKVFCKVRGAFIGMKPGAAVFEPKKLFQSPLSAL